MKTEKPKKSSGLTPAQRSAFFRALQAASIELGHDTPEWVDAVMAFCRWLVAPATEKEGGKDGNE